MALNPFFLQGSPLEQNLVQDLINEHIRIYGIDVHYIPRKYLKTSNIIKEVQSSKFDDNFVIEAYVNNYEGYSPGSDIMSKFGIRLKNELSLTISRERFEEFISPFLEGLIEGNKEFDRGEDLLFATRPKEGDLIYFPLGQRIFEIKRVEFEQPFYQLGKNYIYELQCELFEYEDEEIDTSISEIEDTMEEVGYITKLILVGSGQTAQATASIASGVIERIYISNDGYGYSKSPTVTIDPPLNGLQATAEASVQTKGGIKSVSSILLTNAGYGYTVPPKIIITGGNGVGASATCSISTSGVYSIDVLNEGTQYYTVPNVNVSSPSGIGITATVKAEIDGSGLVSKINIVNAGVGYTSNPTITISPPPQTGIGTYYITEEVIGQTSGTKAVVKDWTNTADDKDKILLVQINNGTFIPGEILKGTASSASYVIRSFNSYTQKDPYSQNKEIEDEADKIIDFSETNPFGNY